MDQHEVERLMEKHGVPGRDVYDLPESSLRFPDGAGYRMEISGIERPEVLEVVVGEARIAAGAKILESLGQVRSTPWGIFP